MDTCFTPAKEDMFATEQWDLLTPESPPDLYRSQCCAMVGYQVPFNNGRAWWGFSLFDIHHIRFYGIKTNPDTTEVWHVNVGAWPATAVIVNYNLNFDQNGSILPYELHRKNRIEQEVREAMRRVFLRMYPTVALYMAVGDFKSVPTQWIDGYFIP